MPNRNRQLSASPRVWLGALLLLLLSPPAAMAQQQIPPQFNQEWAAGIAEKLKLDPAQHALLDEFVTTAARAALFPPISATELRAMSLLQSGDYWLRQQAAVLDSLQTDVASLRRFYNALSPDQQRLFDDATRGPAQSSTVAADAVTSRKNRSPDYKLPARTEPGWLVKPSAENISRVYPSAAVRNRVAGKALLACIADEDGYLTECTVRSETPEGMGFGNAALEITGYMRMNPATVYGVPVRSQLQIPVDFAPRPAN